MGYPPLAHESITEVQEAIERILATAHGAGKYAGMFCTQAEYVRRRYAQGCECSFFLLAGSSFSNDAALDAVDLMNLGGDVVALMEWNGQQLSKLEDITGKKSTNMVYY